MDDRGLIRLEGVTKVYHKDEVEVWALRGVDIIVRRGEFIALVGPSGSGKSTLLNIVGGIDRPTAGRYLFGGSEIAGYSDYQLSRFRNKRVGVVFQSFNLLSDLTAWENVALPLYYAGLTLTARRLKASAALQAVGLGDRLTHYPGQLSGGEEQRVAFARAVVNDPEVVVADEPTGNLDSQAQSQIAKTLLGLRASGRTIVMATHNTDMADLADRRFGLVDGRITSSD